jgi:transcription initiation factor TFIID subunit TAF12
MNEYPNLEILAICRENVAKTYETYLNFWVDSEFSVSIFIQLLFQADIPKQISSFAEGKGTVLLYNKNESDLHCKKKPCRNFSDSDVDSGRNRPIYQGVGNFLPHGRLVCYVRCLRRNLKNSDMAFFCSVGRDKNVLT